uniref:Uncharacterized protein n=1 Tax=Timema shepardi TaxID=629360 RepID=A0A7R9AN22_TIMSH|nr:unnamed protein product [Timema shepardi]
MVILPNHGMKSKKMSCILLLNNYYKNMEVLIILYFLIVCKELEHGVAFHPFNLRLQIQMEAMVRQSNGKIPGRVALKKSGYNGTPVINIDHQLSIISLQASRNNTLLNSEIMNKEVQLCSQLPKIYNTVLDSETDEPTSIKYECDFDRTFNIPWSLEGAIVITTFSAYFRCSAIKLKKKLISKSCQILLSSSCERWVGRGQLLQVMKGCTETLLEFLEQDQENRSCSETLQEFLEHNQDSLYQAQPVFQDSRFSIIQRQKRQRALEGEKEENGCSDALLEFLEQNQESVYKSQPLFMDGYNETLLEFLEQNQDNHNNVYKSQPVFQHTPYTRKQFLHLLLAVAYSPYFCGVWTLGYTGTLLEFLEQNQENMYNSQPFFMDSQFATKQVGKRRNQSKGLFITTQDGYLHHSPFWPLLTRLSKTMAHDDYIQHSPIPD